MPGACGPPKGTSGVFAASPKMAEEAMEAALGDLIALWRLH